LSPEDWAARAAAGARRWPDDEWVYSQWPCNVKDFPSKGEPDSFNEIQVWAWRDCGTVVKLAGKSTQTRARAPTLTVKGPRARAVYAYIEAVARRLVGWKRSGRSAPDVREAGDDAGEAVTVSRAWAPDWGAAEASESEAEEGAVEPWPAPAEAEAAEAQAQQEAMQRAAEAQAQQEAAERAAEARAQQEAAERAAEAQARQQAAERAAEAQARQEAAERAAEAQARQVRTAASLVAQALPIETVQQMVLCVKKTLSHFNRQVVPGLGSSASPT